MKILLSILKTALWSLKQENSLFRKEVRFIYSTDA